MKLFKMILLAATVSLSLIGSNALADTTNTPPTKPPTVLPPKLDLAKLPPELRALITDFIADRDHYLDKQKALLAKLQGATDEQRAIIRQQLQANREAFLEEAQSFRKEIKEQLAELKLKIHNEELNRLIDGSHDGGGHPHKGHN